VALDKAVDGSKHGYSPNSNANPENNVTGSDAVRRSIDVRYVSAVAVREGTPYQDQNDPKDEQTAGYEIAAYTDASANRLDLLRDEGPRSAFVDGLTCPSSPRVRESLSMATNC
jgi:hypothetical protein